MPRRRPGEDGADPGGDGSGEVEREVDACWAPVTVEAEPVGESSV